MKGARLKLSFFGEIKRDSFFIDFQDAAIHRLSNLPIFDLEVGLNPFRRFRIRIQHFQPGRGGEKFLGFPVVILMVRTEIQHRFRNGHAPDLLQEFGAHDTVLVMPLLRPGIGKVNVHGLRAGIRQEVAQEDESISQHHSGVLEL